MKIISERLQKELPGLRGFSENSLKNMRKFYEEWRMLDANSAIQIVKLQESNSTTAVVELQHIDNKIDIFNSIVVRNIKDFPVENFFKYRFRIIL